MHPPNRRAFSLVEAAIASTVMGVLVVGALNTLGRIGHTRGVYADRQIASGMCLALADEIQAQPYEDPSMATTTLGADGDDAGAGRAGWDDVDDYAGLAEKPPASKAGATIRTGETGWSRSVNVEWISVAVNGLVSVSPTETGVKRVTVRVLRNDRALADVTFLRTRARDEVAP